ncbi:MAG: hypothetical protein AAF961_05930 [Planctomycetota bacterium]
MKVGGELLTRNEQGQTIRLPMSTVANLNFQEQLLAWSNEAGGPRRSLRRYGAATATLKADDAGLQRDLPTDRRTVVAAIEEGKFVLNGLDAPLTRDERDLVAVIGDTLSIDQLLPGRDVHAGEPWSHEDAAIGSLLAMDHVAVCEASSVMVGAEGHQVRIKLSGTIHGSVDGSATEAELRAEYLYDLDDGRITKFNLAVKENRKVGEIAPGLDVVAKLSVIVTPLGDEQQPFDQKQLERATAAPLSELRELVVDSAKTGYRFRHRDDWYATAEQPRRRSLRLLRDGAMLAHCNVRALPARSPRDVATVEELEADVRRSLGDRLANVAAAREWDTSAGHRCLAVFANGAVQGIPLQWRYYLIAEPNQPLISIETTVERSELDRFADADRTVVDTLEFTGDPIDQATESQPLVR